jgi:DNA polymerase (family 10)
VDLVTNAEIARVFAQIATMLEIEGANPFRVRAYREGARVIESQAEPMASLAKSEGALEALAGIGKDLAAKIRDVALTGTTAIFEDLKKKIPLEVVGLTELQGLGPKRVGTLFEVLGIRNRQDLEKAAKEGRLRDLPGFGEKVEQNVLKALDSARQWTGRMSLAAAWPVAHALAEHVGRVPGVKQVELAGSFRRRKETVGDLDVLACGGDADEVMHAFITHPAVAEVLGRGDTKSSVLLSSGLQVDLRVVPEESFGAALLYFTGSKEHNIELRKIAVEQGMSLNEYGLTRGQKVVASRTEEDVYRALGAKWIPPELREARGEVELARYGQLPQLVTLEDLKADLHMHTTRTDGRDSVASMIRGAIARGYEYVAITEHSKSLPMTSGFDAARVRRSVREIEVARREFPGIQILHGLEVDILADGTLDLDDETLALLDWVIVALHSRLEMAAEPATERVLRALANPHVDAFAHPSGRLIGFRDPVPFDVERAAEAAARHGVLMEINASPDRLDLNEVNARMSSEKGCRFVVNTDAHAVTHLDNVRFGVFQARRAGLSAEQVWNTYAWPAFREHLTRARSKRGVPVPEMRVDDGTAPPPEPAEAKKPVPKATLAARAARAASETSKRPTIIRVSKTRPAAKSVAKPAPAGGAKPATGGTTKPAPARGVKPAAPSGAKPPPPRRKP